LRHGVVVLIIIRSHRSSAYVRAAYCYGLLQSTATLCSELCKNGWTDRDAVWDLDLGGSKEACISWG